MAHRTSALARKPRRGWRATGWNRLRALARAVPGLHDQNAYDVHAQHGSDRKLEHTPGDAKWTVPLIFQVSQILKIGKQPISIQIGGKYYADSPSLRTGLGLRFNVTFLYPTAKQHSEPDTGKD